MVSLPILDRSPRERPSRWRTFGLHGFRLVLFLIILLAIHRQHRWFVAQKRGERVEPLKIEQVLPFFPKASSLGDYDAEHGGQQVTDATGKLLGFVVQTSPEADKVIGFSGPTNSLVAFGADNRVLGASVIRSGDTREHLQKVVENEQFMTALRGLTWQEASHAEVDAVSGATLTSSAIVEGIAVRLGGENPSSRFPNEIAVDEAKQFFLSAVRLEVDPEKPSLRRVLDGNGQLLGRITRTSPHADQMMGYQGPTDTLIALDAKGLVVGAMIRSSFDNNEPYPFVNYVKEDEYFFNTFKGFRLEEIAQLDMVDAGIEGVSGATKTSTTVAEAIIHTAKEIGREKPLPKPKPLIELRPRDYGTAAMVVAALGISLTHLRGRRWLRVMFQVALIVYLGFINADMVSQALLVGWAQNGVAWRVAPALVLLTLAALICPLLTGRQVYCTHLCPFGAMQDLLRYSPRRVQLLRMRKFDRLRARVPVLFLLTVFLIPMQWLLRLTQRQLRVPRKVDRLLRLLPAMLLTLVVLVAMLHWPLSLVGIEPFDAFVFRIAGWATLSIAAVGLVFAAFKPMAYCHYGCPTGAMLNFLRFSGASGRFSRRDWFACALAAAAIGLSVLG
ncbi:MAG: FMN-binding protein [Planctomycetales bacterium]|nr:FMN-binding protein [Planctomycetales bacterium]